MSRALNLDLPEEHVRDACARNNAPFTQIETLLSGGTRVVFKNADDAATIGRLHKGKVISGAVTRSPSRLLHG
jgi:hypothetical protein